MKLSPPPRQIFIPNTADTYVSCSNRLLYSNSSCTHNANGTHNILPHDMHGGSHSNAFVALKGIRCKNLNRIIIGHLNINTIRNKMQMLTQLITRKINILLISEIKLDDSFSSTQFLLPGFSPSYRRDRNIHSFSPSYWRDRNIHSFSPPYRRDRNIHGFSPSYRWDRNIHGGGIMLFIGEAIPSKEIKKI